ncbi:hypothetical protein [Parafrankia irregularis]|uniref:hypothetical protein n=1 Tax=Parafrankia irregularis TaxID=795642 RepID=UPI000B8829BF|nr:hypothetical protein [Parafrankia irregularis]MBE3201944.1 hypothetical protein [Parafrankia sp. CH37]
MCGDGPAGAPGASSGLLGLLDRVDDAALPAIGRVLNWAQAGLGSVGDRPWAGARRAHAAVTARVAVDDAPVAVTGAEPRAARGWAAAGVLEAAFRVVVLGLVVLIVVGAVTTMLRGSDSGGATSGSGSGSGSGAAGSAVSQSGIADAAADADADDAGAAAGPVEPGIVVGPAAGDAAGAYADRTRSELESLSAAAPAADLYAVVSLTAYQTPAELVRTLADYRVTEVFFRVPPDGAETSANVRDPVADVESAFDSAADAAETLGREDTDAVAAQRAHLEAMALRARCGCLYAAVVRAPAERLLELTRRGPVRTVHPAPPGSSPSAVRFVPLDPVRS